MTNRPLKIGIVAQNVVRRDGQGRVALEAARTASSRGHTVTVYAANLADELLDHVNWVRVSVGAGPQVLKDIVLARNVRRAVSARDDSVILVMGACAPMKRKAILYCACFCHAGWLKARKRYGLKADFYRRVHGLLSRRMEKTALASVSFVAAMSPQIAEEVAELAPSQVKVETFPGGVEVSEYEPINESRRETQREKLGVDSQAFVIGLIGEYATGRKGLPLLLEAMQGRSDSSEVLLVHGDGPRDAMQMQLHQMGLEGKVLFPDPKIPVSDVMGACNVVAIPSLYEPFSLVALEAGACALPVIISSTAGAAQVLSKDDAAIVFDTGDAAGLRQALDSVRSEPAKYSAMGERARAVVSTLDWASVGDILTDFLEGVATGDEDVHHMGGIGL
ncbi:MAG: glycosyltransferase family 4 protein [Actinomycetota bacterium]|nr:glycosyltransferase family 4 protein [Actinomycetota bacterium]